MHEYDEYGGGLPQGTEYLVRRSARNAPVPRPKMPYPEQIRPVDANNPTEVEMARMVTASDLHECATVVVRQWNTFFEYDWSDHPFFRYAQTLIYAPPVEDFDHAHAASDLMSYVDQRKTSNYLSRRILNRWFQIPQHFHFAVELTLLYAKWIHVSRGTRDKTAAIGEASQWIFKMLQRVVYLHSPQLLTTLRPADLRYILEDCELARGELDRAWGWLTENRYAQEMVQAAQLPKIVIRTLTCPGDFQHCAYSIYEMARDRMISRYVTSGDFPFVNEADYNATGVFLFGKKLLGTEWDALDINEAHWIRAAEVKMAQKAMSQWDYRSWRPAQAPNPSLAPTLQPPSHSGSPIPGYPQPCQSPVGVWGHWLPIRGSYFYTGSGILVEPYGAMLLQTARNDRIFDGQGVEYTVKLHTQGSPNGYYTAHVTNSPGCEHWLPLVFTYDHPQEVHQSEYWCKIPPMLPAARLGQPSPIFNHPSEDPMNFQNHPIPTAMPHGQMPPQMFDSLGRPVSAPPQMQHMPSAMPGQMPGQVYGQPQAPMNHGTQVVRLYPPTPNFNQVMVLSNGQVIDQLGRPIQMTPQLQHHLNTSHWEVPQMPPSPQPMTSAPQMQQPMQHYQAVQQMQNQIGRVIQLNNGTEVIVLPDNRVLNANNQHVGHYDPATRGVHFFPGMQQASPMPMHPPYVQSGGPTQVSAASFQALTPMTMAPAESGPPRAGVYLGAPPSQQSTPAEKLYNNLSTPNLMKTPQDRAAAPTTQSAGTMGSSASFMGAIQGVVKAITKSGVMVRLPAKQAFRLQSQKQIQVFDSANQPLSLVPIDETERDWYLIHHDENGVAITPGYRWRPGWERDETTEVNEAILVTGNYGYGKGRYDREQAERYRKINETGLPINLSDNLGLTPDEAIEEARRLQAAPAPTINVPPSFLSQLPPTLAEDWPRGQPESQPSPKPAVKAAAPAEGSAKKPRTYDPETVRLSGNMPYLPLYHTARCRMEVTIGADGKSVINLVRRPATEVYKEILSIPGCREAHLAKLMASATSQDLMFDMPGKKPVKLPDLPYTEEQLDAMDPQERERLIAYVTSGDDFDNIREFSEEIPAFVGLSDAVRECRRELVAKNHNADSSKRLNLKLMTARILDPVCFNNQSTLELIEKICQAGTLRNVYRELGIALNDAINERIGDQKTEGMMEDIQRINARLTVAINEVLRQDLGWKLSLDNFMKEYEELREFVKSKYTPDNQSLFGMIDPIVIQRALGHQENEATLDTEADLPYRADEVLFCKDVTIATTTATMADLCVPLVRGGRAYAAVAVNDENRDAQPFFFRLFHRIQKYLGDTALRGTDVILALADGNLVRMCIAAPEDLEDPETVMVSWI